MTVVVTVAVVLVLHSGGGGGGVTGSLGTSPITTSQYPQEAAGGVRGAVSSPLPYSVS